jgi:hypothetical protein
VQDVFTLHGAKVSKNICHKLPEKMLLKGITAVVEEVFLRTACGLSAPSSTRGSCHSYREKLEKN